MTLLNEDKYFHYKGFITAKIILGSNANFTVRLKQVINFHDKFFRSPTTHTGHNARCNKLLKIRSFIKIPFP